MVFERGLRAAAEAPVTRHDLLTNVMISSVEPSAGAERMRRARHRKRQGGVMVNFLIGADAIETLIELGWLDPERRGDRNGVAGAIVGLATRTLALRTRPGG
jgi:hypothetical protein